MRYFKNIILLIVCLFTALLFSGCAQKPVKDRLLLSMAKVDRVYVPLFVFTDLQKQRESELALRRFKPVWRRFYRDYKDLKMSYGLDIIDTCWRDDFARINTLVTTAEVYIKEGIFPEAHNEIREIRIVMRDMRYRNGMEYFLDCLTDIDISLEGILLTLRGQDDISEGELNELRGYFRRAQASLLRAENAKIDSKAFDFKPEKIEAIRKRVKDEQLVLARFAAALSSENIDRIFQEAQDLRPNFIVLYKAFGDFEPIFEQIKKETKRKEQEDAKKEKVRPSGSE